MRIIEHGNTKSKNQKCNNCDCVFEYYKADLKTRFCERTEVVGKIISRNKTFYDIVAYINCPECGERIDLKRKEFL